MSYLILRCANGFIRKSWGGSPVFAKPVQEQRNCQNNSPRKNLSCAPHATICFDAYSPLKTGPKLGIAGHRPTLWQGSVVF